MAAINPVWYYWAQALPEDTPALREGPVHVGIGTQDHMPEYPLPDVTQSIMPKFPLGTEIALVEGMRGWWGCGRPLRGDVKIFNALSVEHRNWVSHLQRKWKDAPVIMIGGRGIPESTIGSRTGIQKCTRMFIVEVPTTFEKVWQFLWMPYVNTTNRPPQSPEGNLLVGLKTFSWDHQADCQCNDFFPSLTGNSGYGIPENRLVHAFYQELVALNRVNGLLSMQQAIAMGVDPLEKNAKLITRLPNGNPLDVALKQFPDWATNRPEFALAVFALTMLAVSDMHQRDVLHNNLERDTIVYHEKLHPTCADFGYAKPLIRGLDHQECVGVGQTGAPAFAAPETNSIHGPGIEENGYVTIKSDVYAAAAVAFRGLFASSLELDEDQRVDWDQKVAEYAQSQPQPANKLVLDLFRQCLQRDPHMRPSALNAIKQASQRAKFITLAHYNPDDAREPHYIGSPDDWRIYDWAAERKCHSSSVQAWHSVW